MSTHCIFKLEGRRYGSGHATYAQIVCGYCDHTEWHIARDSGVAVRVFRSHGWKVGSKEKQHRCPTCFSKIKSARRTPDNPAIPKEIGKQLKEKIVSAHLKDALLNGSVLTPEGANAMPRLPDDERPPAAKALDGIHPAPPIEAIKPVPGTQSVPGKTLFGTRHNASQAGTRATGSTDGHAFFTVPLGKGWTWKLAVNTTEAERTHWRATRKYGARKPVERKTPLHGAINPKEDTPMPTLSVVETETPMPQPNDRQPTRDERSAIHDELTKMYDIVGQRYAGNDSDEKVAGRLDVPRAWVTNLREMFFGDHDRNQQTVAKIKELDAAILLAGDASKRLMEMATEAEALEQSLRAARKKLEG